VAFACEIDHCFAVRSTRYSRQLASEIIPEFDERKLADQDATESMTLIDTIVPFCPTHNAETDACDLLPKTEQLDELSSYVDQLTFSRVCIYLIK
jgi:26S proteasome regulatory subunit N1